MRLIPYYIISFFLLLTGPMQLLAQPVELGQYNVVWSTQSENAAASMPLGGGGIGCNVWVENNELLLYFSQSGSFDENNTFLKSGRLRIRLSPDPISNLDFRQELRLADGSIYINSANKGIRARIHLWVDVFHPVIHIDIQTNKATKAEAIYETWRFRDQVQTGKLNNANSWKWAKHLTIMTRKDQVGYEGRDLMFYHRNSSPTVFDATVLQQGLDSIKNQLFNPLAGLTSGGLITGKHFKQGRKSAGIYINTPFEGYSLISERPSRSHQVRIFLLQQQTPSAEAWKQEIQSMSHKYKARPEASRDWWRQFWERSFIFINTHGGPDPQNEAWQAGRNYQLFRYMLGCNAYGAYPTKFNGGLFTVDPVFTDSTIKGTPDHRNWGGGTFTAQNQRLVYWPMLKSGDFDMMRPQFDFYNRLLQTALLRTRTYWNHGGAHFNEQVENFGLPNPTEYGWKRPTDFDPGLEYNAWLEYEWDTVLEFCAMILDTYYYNGSDIRQYLPLIQNALIFFDEHYQYLARKRSARTMDENGHLILYPGSAAETFKMAYNPSSTIAALTSLTEALLRLPDSLLQPADRKYFQEFQQRIPPIPYMQYKGHTTIAPAITWARVNNTETPQLYPVFPWGLFGMGRPGLDTAINTYRLDSFAVKFRSAKGWKQDNIFAARLGLTEEAARLTLLKLKDSERRFPAFWGPGFDWVPDHNWGGSGMIGLQEMLLQAVDNRLYLFPAWPDSWDVHFRLHAPGNTIVEARLRSGKIQVLQISPKSRQKDIISSVP
ncbi:DUF5703 domain-containing protein [Niabella terrae]